MLNPLFSNDNSDESDESKAGLDPFRTVKRHDKKIEPLHKLSAPANPAVELIRQKVQALYAKEPSVKQELAEAEAAKPRSKHQKFMYELSTSGKSLAEIQTAWHNYYQGLPDTEKHEVWQEFYEANSHSPHYQQFAASHQHTRSASEQPKIQSKDISTNAKHLASAVNPNAVVGEEEHIPPSQPPERRTLADLKRQIAGKANAGGKITAKHHVQSLLFGVGIGLLVLFVTLFSFFNEYFIAPFIQPSRHVSATPIIVGTDGVAASTTPEVIIPKINVEIPLDFSVTSTNESQIENALENGVVHYPTTVLPGQTGNTAFFGHSSNNIFNPGKYKFAFVLLHELVPGDTFYLTYGGKAYAYQVYDKQVVEPSNVSVLNNVPGKAATATLITCDPPGTSLHRLVVWGEQVSPSPADNTAGTANPPAAGTPTALPDNGPSLWSRMIHGISSWF